MTGTNIPTAVPADDRPRATRADDPGTDVPRACVVIRACAVTCVPGDRHPLLAVAAALAAQHRQRVEAQQLTCDPFADDRALAIAARAIAAADTGRTVLIHRIDGWVPAALQENRRASVHTESLGQLVDRLAATWTQWNLIKDREDPSSADLASALLRHVSELSIGYDDLVADLRAGRRRLPRHQNPIAA